MANKNIYVNDFDKITTGYLNEIGVTEPLSKKEEARLWKRYKKNGDMSARDKIIRSNLKFVAKIAGMYRGRGLSYSDLIAEGNLGFIKSLDHFDSRYGNRILSYSVWWIRQTISEALEKRNLMVGDYTPEELDTLKEGSIAREEITEEPSACDDDAKKAVREIMKTLSGKERKMLSMYYGLDGGSPSTLEEVGREFGLTRERVRQINNRSLMKLRSGYLEKKLAR